MIWRISALFAAIAALPGNASAASCENITFETNRYTVCEVDLTKNVARLYLYDENGAPYGDFSALPDDVIIATNGGMYHTDRRPVGHYIEDSKELMRVVEGAGPGNFGLVPNGVLCLRNGQAAVLETSAYVRAAPDCIHATQSGPMLVLDGTLHPRFIDGSDSRKRRGGVGVDEAGTALYIAVTRNAVNFHDFGTLFRDRLGTPDALFLDGSITRLYDRASGRRDGGVRMGPILAILD